LIPLSDTATSQPAEPEAGEAADATAIAAVKSAIGERVSDVRASQRLTASAVCLAAGGQGLDRELERLLARQGQASPSRSLLASETPAFVRHGTHQARERLRDPVVQTSAVR